jgi:hypothetical protein
MLGYEVPPVPFHPKFLCGRELTSSFLSGMIGGCYSRKQSTSTELRTKPRMRLGLRVTNTKRSSNRHFGPRKTNNLQIEVLWFSFRLRLKQRRH